MNAKELQTFLKFRHACPSGRRFCSGLTLRQAWRKCTRSDWMSWLFYALRMQQLYIAYLPDEHERLCCAESYADSHTSAEIRFHYPNPLSLLDEYRRKQKLRKRAILKKRRAKK